MTKYDGIKVVEVTRQNQSTEQKPVQQKEQQSSFFTMLLVRILLCGIAFFALFLLGKSDNSFAQNSTQSIKSAVMFDLNERDESQLGSSAFWNEIKKFFGKSTENAAITK